MGNAFFSGRLGIPNPREIQQTTIKIPFFYVGDEAFPLKPNLMRPYPRKDLDYSKRIFNYLITRARRTVECSFRMLTKKFGALQTAMETRVEIAEEVVKSACVLHNFIQKEETFNYFHGGGGDDASDFSLFKHGADTYQKQQVYKRSYGSS
jgi:hypothetical protein